MEHAKVTQEQGTLLHNIGYETYHEGDKLTDVATWLRTVHGWHVSPQPNFDYNASQWIYEAFVLIGEDWKKFNGVGGFFTHDLALSAGIDFILTKLNEDA
jgi:hypothetical protein